jgi:hypothetical protein
MTHHSVSSNRSSAASVSRPTSLLWSTWYRYSAVSPRTYGADGEPVRAAEEGGHEAYAGISMREELGEARDAGVVELGDREKVDDALGDEVRVRDARKAGARAGRTSSCTRVCVARS